jgi:hypothetical protein
MNLQLRRHPRRKRAKRKGKRVGRRSRSELIILSQL